MNIHESVLKALSGVLPEEVVAKTSEVISESLDNAVAQIEAQYEAKLEEAYKEFEKQTNEIKSERDKGYNQAFDLICNYKDRIALQNEEHKRILDEGFHEAWQMLEDEKKKNDKLETDLYEEYEEKLKGVKKFMARKLDEFLPSQGKKYYEAARADLLNDPVFAEHKQAFEKILEAAATVLSDEDFSAATSSKAESTLKENEELKKQVQILEGKNMRLSMDHTRLLESVKSTNVLTESKKERVEKARKSEGRGEVVSEGKRKVVIAEHSEEPVSRKDSQINEENQNLKKYWLKVAGLENGND